MCTSKGHGSLLSPMDAEPRKHGYRSVFDTLVVHAVNDECWAGHMLGSSLRKTLRLGNSRKAGNLMRLAGACINGGACGLIRQYTGNLTSRSRRGSPAFYMPPRNPLRRGAAWLSSVRVVRCRINFSNERNPRI